MKIGTKGSSSSDHDTDRRLLGLLVVLYIVLRAPLLFNARPNDYDAPLGPIDRVKIERCYKPLNAPGSPLYEMGVAVLYHKLIAPLTGNAERTADGTLMGKDMLTASTSVFVVFKLLSALCGWLIVGLFYNQLRRAFSSGVSFWVCAALVCHPVFIWMSSAFSHDILAMSLGYSAFSLAQQRRSGWGPAVMSAIAVGIRFTAIGFAVAAGLSYALTDESGAWKIRLERLAWFMAIVLGLVVLFYLPAYVAYGMNLSRQFETPDYGTTAFSRLKTGILLFRHVFLIWLPMAGYLIASYHNSRKRGERRWINPWDPFIIVLLSFCMIEYRTFSAAWFVLFLIAGSLAAVSVWKGYQDKCLPAPADAGHVWLVFFTMLTVCLAPFSRNYFLPMIPSLLYWVAKRIPTKRFWATAAVVSLIPMFYYPVFNFAKPSLSIYRFGFYDSLLGNLGWSEINDFGYKSHEPALVLGWR